MGEIAEDCYDRAMEEMGDQEDVFFGCGSHHDYLPMRPTQSLSLNRGIQHLSRPQRVLDLEVPVDRDWMFVTIEKSWPFNTHNFKVMKPDLNSAVKDFYENEWHKPFRHDKTVPDYHADVQLTTGGWIVYGETQTVLIFAR